MTLDKLQSMMRRVRQLAFRLVGGSCLRPLTLRPAIAPRAGSRLAGRILAAAQYCALAELPANVIPLRRAA